jgi:hypothetical protein
MGSIRTVTCQLEGIVCFYAATEVEIAATVEIPAPVFTLMLTKIHSDLGSELIIDLVHVMHHEYVFGWAGTVGFKIEAVVTVGMLEGEQGFIGSGDSTLELNLEDAFGEPLVGRYRLCA